MIRSKPFMAGFLIWNLADLRTEQSALRAVGNRKGLLTRVKEPKLAARVVTELFRQKSASGVCRQ